MTLSNFVLTKAAAQLWALTLLGCNRSKPATCGERESVVDGDIGKDQTVPNLVVMPGRDVESKAENNPVMAALHRALTLAQDVGMARVLIIYEPNDGQKLGVIDSGMTIAEAVHMAEVFKFWMLRESVGGAASDKGTP